MIHPASYGIRGLDVKVQNSTFRIDGPESYAIKGKEIRVARSSFENTGDSSAIVYSGFNVGNELELADSSFRSQNQSGTAVDISHFHVMRSSFVGYETALRAEGDGLDVVEISTFVGNKIAYLGKYVSYQSGIVQNCYFWRNGLAQNGNDAKGNIYVENTVAYKQTRLASDLLVYRNLVGFWNPMRSGLEWLPEEAYGK